MQLTDSQFRSLARTGAQQRLDALRQEEREILTLFPEFRLPKFRNGRIAPIETVIAEAPKRTMSAANRRAVSQRMRAYWAKRRTEKTAAARK